MFLRIGFVEALIFCLFSKVIQCNTAVENKFIWWLKKINERVLIEGKMLSMNSPERVAIFTTNFWKLIAFCDLWWLNSKAAVFSLLPRFP